MSSISNTFSISESNSNSSNEYESQQQQQQDSSFNDLPVQKRAEEEASAPVIMDLMNTSNYSEDNFCTADNSAAAAAAAAAVMMMHEIPVSSPEKEQHHHQTAMMDTFDGVFGYDDDTAAAGNVGDAVNHHHQKAVFDHGGATGYGNVDDDDDDDDDLEQAVLQDVPIPVHSVDAGTSLPTAEEIRNTVHATNRTIHSTTGNISNSNSSSRKSVGRKAVTAVAPWRRRWVQRLVAVLVLLSALLGIAVGVSRRRNKKNSSSSSSRQVAAAVDYLAMYNVSTRTSLTMTDPPSPQNLAVQWLAETDTLDLAVPAAGTAPVAPPAAVTTVNSTTTTALQEDTAADANLEAFRYVARYVMALNYFSLSGPSWFYPINFLSGKDICQWKGPVVAQTAAGDDDPNAVTTTIEGVFCNADTNVPIFLKLDDNNLRGSIPTENGVLTSLLTFSMERNKIAGTIPTELCSLTSLTSLAFGFNQLKGEIPSCIGQLASLELLALHKNDLVGSLPSEMGVSLKKLKRLFLSANILTGDPKDVFNGLARLELLMADTNKFLSKIDDDFLLHHKSLKWLDLSDNDFQMGASIPSHFFSMTNLEVLDLSMNSLRGSFPAISGTNTVLKYLSIFDNDMQGGLSGLTKLRALRHLDISKNYFDGPIRLELAELTDLRLLFLGNNRFIPDHIPKSFLNLTKLEDLSLRHTNRTGPFDPSFLPASLVYLDLGTNQLSGTVPESIGAFSHLEFLMLNDNSNITGALPVSFSNLQKLRAVFLDGTSIGSNVSQVCDLPKFVAPKGNEIAFADCASPSSSPSLCGCCQCCSDAISKNGCSIPFQLNLRSKWSKDFQSLNFKVTNGTVFLNRDYIPPV